MSALDAAKLYGLRYVGHRRIPGKVYEFDDLLTGNRIEVRRISQLPTAVLANRETGFEKLVKDRAVERAVVLSEKFHGSRARFETAVEIDWPESLVAIGVCARVDYIADKFGDGIIRYWHEFEGVPMLYADPELQADGNQLMVIIGKYKIESVGITG